MGPVGREGAGYSVSAAMPLLRGGNRDRRADLRLLQCGGSADPGTALYPVRTEQAGLYLFRKGAAQILPGPHGAVLLRGGGVRSGLPAEAGSISGPGAGRGNGAFSPGGLCGDGLGLDPCVPMSRKKRRSRGFNQSEELARQVAGRLEIPYRSLLDLEFEPQIQHSLTAEERRANVLGAYCVRRNAPVEGCRILLVDDVFTTGSTAVECAKVLMFSGAQSVHLLCAAITLPEKRNGRVDK